MSICYNESFKLNPHAIALQLSGYSDKETARKREAKDAKRVYVETQSDYTVRNWLQSHHIPSPRGREDWRVSTIRDVLRNRRYIGQIEINRANEGVEGLREESVYRIVPAAHGPLIPTDLFELAQSVRGQKGKAFPNTRGGTRSSSQTKSGRVYLLQGLLKCAHYGHPMSPHYVFHKASKSRKKESFVSHYVCTEYRR